MIDVIKPLPKSYIGKLQQQISYNQDLVNLASGKRIPVQTIPSKQLSKKQTDALEALKRIEQEFGPNSQAYRTDYRPADLRQADYRPADIREANKE